MTQITIKQSRKPTASIWIALLMLSVLGLAYVGADLGRLANERDRLLRDEAIRQKVLNTPPEEYQRIREALDKALADQQKKPPPKAPTTNPND